MRKPPTDAQKQASKLRREKFRGFVKALVQMPEADRIALANKMAITTCEGHTLSVCNQMLVAMQCRHATLVGGFRQWKKQGRTVKKGEHGLMIWVPFVYGEKNGDDTPQPSEIDGKEEKTEVRFLVGTVFDIGQTAELGQETEGEEATV